MRAFRFVTACAGLACIGLATWLLMLESELADARIAARYSMGLGLPDPFPAPPVIHLVLLAGSVGLALVLLAARRAWVAALAHWLLSAWKFGAEACSRTWHSMLAWERWSFWVLLIGCTALRCWRAWMEPPVLDEALTGIHFVTRGPLVALTWYPAPNNHILHSVLASLAAWLPVDLLFAMRLPAIAAMGIAQALMHLLLRRCGGAFAAVLGLAAFIGSAPMLYYDHLSRGYALMVLAQAVCFAASAAWLRATDDRALRVLVIAGIIGLFTMPSFLYALVALFIGLAILRSGSGHALRSLATAAMLIGFGALVCYGPALFVSGSSAIGANDYVRPVGWETVGQRWPEHWRRVYEGLLGLNFGWLVAIALVGLAHMVAKEAWRDMVRLAALVMLVSLIIPFAHGVIPFERTWLFLLVPLAVCLAALLDRLSARLPWPWLALPLLLLWLTWQQKRHHEAFAVHEQEAIQAEAVCTSIRSVAPKRVLAIARPFGTYIRFDMQRNGLPHKVVFADSIRSLEGFTLLVGLRDQPPSLPGWQLLCCEEGPAGVWVRAR